MTLLNTLTANNSSNLQDTTSFTATYTYYKIIFDDLTPTSAYAALTAQYYINNEWASDPTYNNESYGNDSGGNNAETNNGTSLNLWSSQRSGPNANTGLFGTMTIFNPLATTSNTSYIAELYAPSAYNGKGCIIYSGGSYLGNQLAVTGISFSFKNGNISSGAIRIYGWA